MLAIEDRGQAMWNAGGCEIEHPHRDKRIRVNKEKDSDASECDENSSSSSAYRRDDIVTSDNPLAFERGDRIDPIDDPFLEVEEEWAYMEYDDAIPDPEIDAALGQVPEPIIDDTHQSAVMLGFAEGELDVFPQLSHAAEGHEWVVPPRCTLRPLRKPCFQKVRARRCFAAALQPGSWSSRFVEEQKFAENNGTHDEAVAFLRRRLEDGLVQQVEHRNTRRRRWYLPPGRPPD